MKIEKTSIDRILNLSLVAFYGEKPIELRRLITNLQGYLARHLQDKFVPYELGQVHGTIIGCEGCKTSQGLVSRWFKERRDATRYINFFDLIDCLQQQVNLPLTIRFGGYNRQANYDFLSRDEHLYDRSFQLQPAGEQTIPVLIGWSWENNNVTAAIDELRRSFQQFGLLHKYHANSHSVDNDFYMRLGTIKTQLSIAEIKAISANIRQRLARQAIDLPLRLQDLAFVQYQDLELPPTKTRTIPINLMTANELQQLYRV